MTGPGKLAARAAEYCHCAEAGKDHCFYCDVQKTIIKLVKERDAARKQCEKIDAIRYIVNSPDWTYVLSESYREYAKGRYSKR